MNEREPLVLCEVGETGIPGLESYSPFCLKVHRALRAAGLPYASRHGAMPSAFKAMNPTAQVPVLLVGDEAVFDSTRILARIAELAPGALAPTDPRERAEAWLWEDYADRALYGFVLASRWADDHNWPSLREAFFGRAPWVVRTLVAPAVRRRILRDLIARDVLRAGKEALWSDFQRVLGHLEARAPRTGFWVGGSVSVADVAIFAQVRSLRTPLTPRQAREIELRPVLVDYLDRVDEVTRATRAQRRDPAIEPLRCAS